MSEVNLSTDITEQWEAEDAIAESKPVKSYFSGKTYAESQLRIIRTTKDYDLSFIPTALNDKINLAPEFQRRSRWTPKKRSLLIESLLLNIPVPPIFLFEHDFDKYEVVDGRQRLEAIRDFLEDKYALKGLQFWDHLNGKKFSKLPDDFKRGLLRRSITAIVLLAESNQEIDAESDLRMVLFQRLNTGGVKLNAQEIRNAIYSGEFKRSLFRLSENPIFRSIWGIPILEAGANQQAVSIFNKQLVDNQVYRKMLDIELVLRFFAVRDVIHREIKGSMSTLLENSMEYHHKHSTSESRKLDEELFIRSITTLKSIFGDSLFRNPRLTHGQPARNLYDAFMVGCSLIDDSSKLDNPDSIKSKLAACLAVDANYERIISKGNSIEAIKDRVFIAKQILEKPTNIGTHG